jgi:dual-specificity kinase
MSTPTTATATLPPHSHYHNPHHHFPYYSTNSSASYRSAPNQLVAPTSRVAPSSYSTTSSYVPSTATQTSSSTANGSSFSSGSSLARSHRQDLELPAILEPSNYTTMPASKARPTNGGSPDSRKRRRHSPVDWNKFYGGQVPKEIIVIDDSPGPESAAVSAAPASQALVNGGASYSYANGANGGPVTANTSAARHAPKRRKRDDDAPTGSGTRYDPVHHSRVNASTTTPHQNGAATPSASTISSSDRTNSAIHTTAATSLGSLSSNSQYDHDVQPGHKRKRTRQQVANEVKRRENAIIGHAYPSYHPPPQPPKKAADVHVRVIPDVNTPFQSTSAEDILTDHRTPIVV